MNQPKAKEQPKGKMTPNTADSTKVEATGLFAAVASVITALGFKSRRKND